MTPRPQAGWIPAGASLSLRVGRLAGARPLLAAGAGAVRLVSVTESDTGAVLVLANVTDHAAPYMVVFVSPADDAVFGAVGDVLRGARKIGQLLKKKKRV